jgi:hypothetical protein
MRLEHKTENLVGRRQFVMRVLKYACFAGSIILGSLFIGMWGYHFFERLPWIDAFLNAAMILGGMGPIDHPNTRDGKMFAGLYALFAGLVFIVVAGTILTPILHRILHRLHVGD